ncbi:hypothetical protein FYJ43_09815 [Cutibacterium sp. WCA-380-WT-3A]|uniref:Uncharacterized protein n=1 Tax=Cutibacterium porci TaxID=2605781 RepID=A0A7K0J969_9ACTN|nr:hypothetical protein [Cutibacterium porci]MSS46308.1 hypothetical protein [Cutibacterium porci]
MLTVDLLAVARDAAVDRLPSLNSHRKCTGGTCITIARAAMKTAEHTHEAATTGHLSVIIRTL